MGLIRSNLIRLADDLGLAEFQEKLLNLKIRAFQPKVRFSLEVNNFLIKTAESADELKKILKLRHNVFIEEGLGARRLSGLDFDRYDLLGDHVYLMDMQTDKVIGTYRLLSDRFCNSFYSQNEFKIDRLLKTPGTKLELGRACIDRDHRTGRAITLVWKGLAKYIRLTDSRYLFGCSSVNTTNKAIAYSVRQSLQATDDNPFQIRTTSKYRYPRYQMPQPLESVGDMAELAPTLLKSYLKAGAKIYGDPALDRDFRCTDMFTVLDMQNIHPKYLKKYF